MLSTDLIRHYRDEIAFHERGVRTLRDDREEALQAGDLVAARELSEDIASAELRRAELEDRLAALRGGAA